MLLLTPLAIAFMHMQAPSQPAPVPPPLARVYVFTDPLGAPVELKGRQESLKDLQSALGSKKKSLVLVKTKDEADIVIEVVERTMTVPKVVIGGPVTGTGSAPLPRGPVRAVHLQVTATAGEKEFKFANRGDITDANGSWRTAADDVAKQIEKWIQERSGAK